MRRLLWVFVVLSLVAAACGGGGSDEAEGSTETESGTEVETNSPAGAEAQTDAPDEEIDAAVTALADLYGDEGAFTVGVFALEQGYGAQQVVGGAIAGQIQTDGSIEGADPEGPPLGLIVIDTNSVLLASLVASAQSPESIETFHQKTRQRFADDLAERTGFPESLSLLILLLAAVFDTTVSDRLGSFLNPGEVLHAIILGVSLEDYRAIGNRADDDSQDEPSEGDDPDPEPEPEELAGVSAGLDDVADLAGPGSTMIRETIGLSIDGARVTLIVDLLLRTPVEYVGDVVTCSDNFTVMSGASDLTIDGVEVTGTVELLFELAGDTECPQVEQPDLGVDLAGVTGQIGESVFDGEFSTGGLVVPFTAAVG